MGARRQVRATGLSGIDPARTDLPADWRSLSSYIAGVGSVLELSTLQRGQAVLPLNSVTLHRTLWPDSEGAGFTVQDRLQGEMHRDWRLDLATGELGHVRFGNADQLITVGPSGRRGVEARSGKLDVLAE